MDICCAMCCPHPDGSVIQPVGAAGKWRYALKLVIYGEIACTIMRMIIFDPMHGLFNAIAIWIDYMGYATMHFCQTMIICFSGGLDLGMLLLNLTTKGFKEKHIDTEQKKIIFYTIMGFEIVKMIVGYFA